MQTSDSPRFASPVTLLKKLAFTGDGAVLLHATKQQVFVWDVKNTRLCGTVDGELLGIAEDGQTFITRLSDQNWVKRDIQARSGIGRQSFLADPIPVSRFALWHTMSCTQLHLPAYPRKHTPCISGFMCWPTVTDISFDWMTSLESFLQGHLILSLRPMNMPFWKTG